MRLRGLTARLFPLFAIVSTLLAAGCVSPGASHAIVGTWSLPIDGKPGFVRRFDRDGTVKVWWPDGKLAAEGRYFVVDAGTVGVEYPNRDTDVVRLLDSDTLEIQHVEFNGYHRKYMAKRVAPSVE